MSDIERIKSIQAMINDRLARNSMPNIEESGVITARDKIILQQMVAEKAKEDGINISDLIGKGQVLGAITKAEIDYVEAMLVDFLTTKTPEEALVTAR